MADSLWFERQMAVSLPFERQNGRKLAVLETNGSYSWLFERQNGG
jgi:hypothetical protein